MTRMPRYLSKQLRAVTSGLSGSAQHATMNGKVRSHNACGKTADVLVAVANLEGEQGNRRLKHRNISCCLNGTMSAMLQMAFILTTPPLAAASLCIGCARSVQRDSCTGIKCVLLIALGDSLQGVHVALVIKHVNATLCKLVTLSSHQSGTMPEMR